MPIERRSAAEFLPARATQTGAGGAGEGGVSGDIYFNEAGKVGFRAAVVNARWVM